MGCIAGGKAKKPGGLEILCRKPKVDMRGQRAIKGLGAVAIKIVTDLRLLLRTSKKIGRQRSNVKL